MFSNRTRRQIKAKFVREERLSLVRLEAALSGKKEVDVDFYERMIKTDLSNGTMPADPMAKFYEGLPTAAGAIKLESNREPTPGEELDLAALLRKKKEETVGPSALRYARPAEQTELATLEEGNTLNQEEEEPQKGEEGEEQNEQGDDPPSPSANSDEGGEENGRQDEGEGPEVPACTDAEQPFDFAGAIQLRTSA